MSVTSTGNLRDRITLQSPPTTRDAHGQRTGDWTDVATVYAEVTALRGREYFAAGAMQQPVDYRVRIRFRETIDGTMRVLWRGKLLTIVGEPIDADRRRTILELMCASGTRDAR